MAIIEGNAVIGRHCFIGYFSLIRPGVVIGDHSEVRYNCYIAEDVTIGNNSHIFQFTNVGKGAVIEDKVWIGAKVMITNTRNIAHLRSFETQVLPCTIKYGARIASCVKLAPGVTIGRNASVELGSVVKCDIPDEQVWHGNPAVFKRMVSEQEMVK
jgi:acetyltransferase-like isoleucine patch superfamily enzyme